MLVDRYTRTNFENWESRVPIRTGPKGYDLQRFIDDADALSDVVAFDAPRLGELSGQRVVHLQCHLGTDTLSLARLGGSVTGVDFSPAALAAARELADRAGPTVRYVESTIDDVPSSLQETFDLVYTGVGALNWLPSIRRWATIVEGLIAPGGRGVTDELHGRCIGCASRRYSRSALWTTSATTSRPPSRSAGTGSRRRVAGWGARRPPRYLRVEPWPGGGRAGGAGRRAPPYPAGGAPRAGVPLLRLVSAHAPSAPSRLPDRHERLQLVCTLEAVKEP